MRPTDYPFFAYPLRLRHSDMIEKVVSTDRRRCARKLCEFPTGNMLLETRSVCIAREHRMGGTAWVGECCMIGMLSG